MGKGELNNAIKPTKYLVVYQSVEVPKMMVVVL